MLIARRVNRYLHLKRFHTLTYSDVSRAFFELRTFDAGFTHLFVFVGFLASFFLALSLQLDVHAKGAVRVALSAAIGDDWQTVSSVDGAFACLERIYAANFQSAYGEHECFFCSEMDDLLKRRVGINVCSEVCGKPEKYADHPFYETLLPGCALFCNAKCYAPGICKDFVPADYNPSDYHYSPHSAAKEGVDAYQQRLLSSGQCLDDDFDVFGNFPKTSRMANYLLQDWAEGVKDLLPPSVPNVSADYLVDCTLTIYDRQQCQSASFGGPPLEDDGPPLDCRDLARRLLCGASAPPPTTGDGDTRHVVPTSSGEILRLDLSCPIVASPELDCRDDGVRLKRSMLHASTACPQSSDSLAGRLSEDCRSKCFSADDFSSAFGNGRCPTADVSRDPPRWPALNCERFEWDGGDCRQQTPEGDEHCEGRYDCLGECVRDKDCEAKTGLNCEEWLTILAADRHICAATAYRINLSCPMYGFNSGACDEGGDASADEYDRLFPSSSDGGSRKTQAVVERPPPSLPPQPPFLARNTLSVSGMVGPSAIHSRPDVLPPPRGGWGTTTTEKLQRGGWIGKNMVVGAGIFVSYVINERESCKKERNRSFDDYSLCDSGSQVTVPIFVAANKVLVYSEELERHIDLVDLGHWG